VEVSVHLHSCVFLHVTSHLRTQGQLSLSDFDLGLVRSDHEAVAPDHIFHLHFVRTSQDIFVLLTWHWAVNGNKRLVDHLAGLAGEEGPSWFSLNPVLRRVVWLILFLRSVGILWVARFDLFLDFGRLGLEQARLEEGAVKVHRLPASHRRVETAAFQLVEGRSFMLLRPSSLVVHFQDLLQLSCSSRHLSLHYRLLDRRALELLFFALPHHLLLELFKGLPFLLIHFAVSDARAVVLDNYTLPAARLLERWGILGHVPSGVDGDVVGDRRLEYPTAFFWRQRDRFRIVGLQIHKFSAARHLHLQVARAHVGRREVSS